MNNYFRAALIFFVFFELLSIFAWGLPALNFIVFGAIVFLTFILAFKKLRYGIYIAASELIIGSHGYLFSLNIGGGDTLISIRMGIFAAVMLAWSVNILRNDNFGEYWRKLKAFKFFKYYLYFVAVLIWGFVWGIIRGNDFGNVFLDFNNWLFLLYLLPLVDVIKVSGWDQRNQYKTEKNFQFPISNFQIMPNGKCQMANIDNNFWRDLAQVYLAALCWLIIKTLILLYVFSHQFIWALPEVYQWVRDTRVGEITMMSNNFYRIFLQSHIFALLGFFLFFSIFNFKFSIFKQLQNFKFSNLKPFIFLIGCLTTVIISFSRSFWLGLVGGLGVYFLCLIFYGLQIKILIRQVFKLFCVAVISFGIIFLIVNFPPKITGENLSSLLSKRTTQMEAAGNSRINMLRPLGLSIIKHPIIGSGWGTTVTYQSVDPRVLEATAGGSGEYTTYAFEWAYLDLLLKVGLVGLAAYFLLIFKILHQIWQQIKNFQFSISNFQINSKFQIPNSKQFNNGTIVNGFSVGLLLAFISLLIVNIFTPYLNHPLGIGAILAVSVLIDKNDDKK